MNGLYFYKLVSPYPEDVTKNCKLTINEIDSNFLTLKDNDIKKAEFVNAEALAGQLLENDSPSDNGGNSGNQSNNGAPTGGVVPGEGD